MKRGKTLWRSYQAGSWWVSIGKRKKSDLDFFFFKSSLANLEKCWSQIHITFDILEWQWWMCNMKSVGNALRKGVSNQSISLVLFFLHMLLVSLWYLSLFLNYVLEIISPVVIVQSRAPIGCKVLIHDIQFVHFM